MIRPGIVRTLFRKDAVDGIRETRVLVSLITPVVLAVLYNALFPDERVIEAKVAYVGSPDSAIVSTLQQRADVGGTISLKLRQAADADEARRLVASQQADVAIVMPPEADAAMRSGASPAITLLSSNTSTIRSFVEASIDATARTLSGQKPPAVITTEVVAAGSSDQSVMTQMGPRKYFVLATVVMMLGMIAVLAVPIMLTEEVEKKTLDAVLLVGSYLEVIAAKALVGLAYAAISVAVMLALTRLRPADMLTFVLGTATLGIALTGIGLLIGGLFKSAQQVYSWSSVMLLPVIGPAFAVGLPVPPAVDALLKALPTSQGMRIMADGLAGEPLFGDLWISYAVVGAWIVAVYGVLAWTLSRRES